MKPISFALITEGVSEHRIIKHIVTKYYKGIETDVNQIHPKIIKGKQDDSEKSGGWDQVLEYCKSEQLKADLIENDYMIIQIDTDYSELNPFNIKHSKEDNTDKTVEELCEDVCIKLQGLIDAEVLKNRGKDIFFAICVHTIECWLLPIYYTNNDKSKTKGCFGKLKQILPKNNIHIISESDKNNPNSRKAYEDILKNWGKRNEIQAAAKHNIGFKKFIESLPKIETEEETINTPT